MNSIPFMDLKRQYLNISNEIMGALAKVCEDAAFSDGPYVSQFEKMFAEYCGVNQVVCVNSGTSALHLALEALDIGPGDEVIIPANTFIATAWAVSYCRATPVFVDCLPDTWNIDPERIEKQITGRTKAVIGVHLYGQPCNLSSLQDICRSHNLFLVEDCAQAHGARYNGKHVGGFGDLGCFSFYPGKNLGSYGEGGAVTTNNQQYADTIRRLRNHGSTRKYYHECVGYNMRMDGFQGAVLGVKLKHLDAWNSRRVEIARMYRKGIANPLVRLQTILPGAESVYHLFVLICPERDKLERHLNESGISVGKHYPVPCHLQKAYQDLGYVAGDFPNAEELAGQCLSLPMFPELKSAEVEHVIKTINTYKGS